MRLMKRLWTKKAYTVILCALAVSAVSLSALPEAAEARPRPLPSKNAKPKKSILKKPQQVKTDFKTKAQRKEHVRATVARENAKLRADAANRRSGYKASGPAVVNPYQAGPIRSLQRRTNTGKTVRINAMTMIKTIPNENRGRKVPKRS